VLDLSAGVGLLERFEETDDPTTEEEQRTARRVAFEPHGLQTWVLV